MPHYIFSRQKSPVPTVITVVAVVAHGEVAVGWNDDIFALKVLWHHVLPVRVAHTRHERGWHCGEIVSVAGLVRAVAAERVLCIGLV